MLSKLQLVAFLLLVNSSFSLIAYFKIEIFYANDFPKYINSSEDSYPPINPQDDIPHFKREIDYDYVFQFNEIKHNIEEPLCIKFAGVDNCNSFCFYNVTINEYDITILNFKDFYYCNDCYYDGKQDFIVGEIKKDGKRNIYTYYNNSNIQRATNQTICLKPTNDISIFYINESKINQNYYKGKIIKYILNNEISNFDINNLFTITGKEENIFELNLVSFKITNIINKKGNIFNEDEELFENSFFTNKNGYLTHKKNIGDGYLMIINLVTKPRNHNTTISTCEEEAKIYLYVSQTNCTIEEMSDNNFCQKCKSDYGKINENKCLHKSEKINNYYFENLNQIWKKCEINKCNFICSICPKGTFIKDSSSQICEKCEIGKYSNKEDNTKCEKCPKGYYSNTTGTIDCLKCPKGYYSNTTGAIDCLKCPDGYTSFPGSSYCFLDCEPGYYSYNNKCIPCKPGFYSEGSSIECLECIPGTYTNKEGMDKCLNCEPGTYNNEYKQTSCLNCPVGYFTSLKGSTYCNECEENKYSLSGYSKCISCEEIIPYCNYCSKEVICMNCNNSAVNGYNNCTICENNINWVYEEEYCKLITKCPKYFYKDKNNNNKINCIEDIKECPYGMDYLNLDTGECKEKANLKDFMEFQYRVKGDEELLNNVSNNIFFEYKQFPEFFINFIKEKNIKIEGLNSVLRIGLEENIKKQDDSNVGIDFGDCPQIIRTKYGIKKSNEIIYKVIDLPFKGRRLLADKYYLYDSDNLETPLNLSVCENQKITIVSPPLNYLDYFENIEEVNMWYDLYKDGYDIFDEYSPIYIDPCFPISILDKYDLTLRDRREFIAKKNLPSCGDGCEYEGDNLKNLQILCYCKIKPDMEKESSFKNGFDDLKTRNNLIVLKCYKLNFSIKGQAKNYFSYLLIGFFIINIFLIIITELNNLDDLIKYCKEYIDNNNINNKDFKNLINMYLNINKNKDIMESYDRFMEEKILNSPPIKRSIHNIKPNLNNQNLILNINKKGIENSLGDQITKIYTFNKKQIFDKYPIVNSEEKRIISGKLNYNKENLQKREGNYYIFLIYSYPMKKRQEYLIEEELNDLDYEYYRNIEKRKWYKILWSLIKTKYDFISTFFIYNKIGYYKEYKLYTIKVMTYLNSLITFIIINILFYTDDTMHRLYEDDGEYNILYRLPKIVIADLSMKLMAFLLELLIDYQEKLIDLRNDLGNSKSNDKIINEKNILFGKGKKRRHIKNRKNRKEIIEIGKNKNIENSINKKGKNIKNTKDEKGRNIKNSFNFRKIFFYIINIILNLFGWYFISCFCAVYHNTQKSLLKDFLISIPLNFISCLLFCLVYLILQIFIIKGGYSRIKKIILKIFKNPFISFIIELGIEFLLEWLI